MFEMTTPWWEVIVRCTVVYFAVLVMIRLSGKRTIGEFSPFDVIVLLLLAEGANGALAGGDESLQGGLIAVATLVLNYIMGFATARSRKLESVVAGNPSRWCATA